MKNDIIILIVVLLITISSCSCSQEYYLGYNENCLEIQRANLELNLQEVLNEDRYVAFMDSGKLNLTIQINSEGRVKKLKINRSQGLSEMELELIRIQLIEKARFPICFNEPEFKHLSKGEFINSRRDKLVWYQLYTPEE